MIVIFNMWLCILNKQYVISVCVVIYKLWNVVFFHFIHDTFKDLKTISILSTPNILPSSQNCVFFFVRIYCLTAWQMQHRTLHDDGSIFQTLIPCLQVPEGENRTFHFPPANCLISCCRWRARRTVRQEERRPRLAQELAHTLTSFVSYIAMAPG